MRLTRPAVLAGLAVAAFGVLISGPSLARAQTASFSPIGDLPGGGFLSDTDRPDEKWLSHYIPEEDLDTVRVAIQAAIQAKSIFNLEHRVHRADGTVGWAQSRAIPVLDDGGNLVEWFGSASDVTARKRAEDALRESEARQRAAYRIRRQLVEVGRDDTPGTLHHHLDEEGTQAEEEQ